MGIYYQGYEIGGSRKTRHLRDDLTRARIIDVDESLESRFSTVDGIDFGAVGYQNPRGGQSGRTMVVGLPGSPSNRGLCLLRSQRQ